MNILFGALTIGAVALLAGGANGMWQGKRASNVPYHVHMWVHDETDDSWPGSGVLITNKHVLTAAVNIYHFNRWDLGFGNVKQSDLQKVTSYEAFVHEKFDDNTDDNNLGVVVVPGDGVQFSRKFSPSWHWAGCSTNRT